MRQRFMGYNVTVFIIFFGLALLEAVTARNWTVVAFWVVIGLVFVYADHVAFRRKHRA